MWKEITDPKSLDRFMETMDYFHDCCVKEILYLSGAYVDSNLAMHPINDQRNLKMIIQRQLPDYSMIEMEFVKLNYLKLFPIGEKFTCEILGATIILKENSIIWCNVGDLMEEALESFTGTVVSASGLRWREIIGHMGNDIYYQALE